MTEELKIVMETLSQMGEVGKEAFIWWLIFDKLLYVLSWLISFAGIVWVVNRALTSFVFAERAMRELRDHLGLGSGALIDSEVQAVVNKVKRMIPKD
jgi:hypothetical protein